MPWTTRSLGAGRCVRTPRRSRRRIPAVKEAPFGWVQEECTPKLYPSAKGEYVKDVVAEMERLNVTAVVFGDPKSVQKWKDAAPKRVIPGTELQRRPATRGARSTGGTAEGFHYRWIQGHGRDRTAVRGTLAERPVGRGVFRARGGAGRSGCHPHGHRRVGSRQRRHAEVPWLDGKPVAARGAPCASPEAARPGDARRVSDDRQHAHAAAGQLARLRRRRGADLELSVEGGEPLHRATRRRRVSGTA